MARMDPHFDDGDFGRKQPWRDWMGGSGAALFKLAKASGDIAGRTAGTVDYYGGSLGAETATGSSDNNVFNLTDQQADDDTWVLVINVLNQLALLPLQCPA